MSIASSPIAAVYGGGGLFGIGYTMGVTEALVDAGIDLADAPALGTSAGSWAAAGLARRIRFLDALTAMERVVPRFPDPRSGRLERVFQGLFGDDVSCPSVRVVACALPRMTRTVLSGAEHPIGQLVAASSAVPGMLAPVRIGRTRYVDGGVRSMASIDLADPADVLLVVLPLSGPMFGPAGRYMERRIRREVGVWRDRNPTGQMLIARPQPAVVALARRPDQLFDPGRARRCYDLAYRQGVELIPEFRAAVADGPGGDISAA
jgi:predicted acylesterase/phospholipase RssA